MRRSLLLASASLLLILMFLTICTESFQFIESKDSGKTEFYKLARSGYAKPMPSHQDLNLTTYLDRFSFDFFRSNHAPIRQRSNSGLVIGAIVLVIIITGGVIWHSRRK